LYGGVFALSRACTKTFFSINASKHNAFLRFREKHMVDDKVSGVILVLCDGLFSISVDDYLERNEDVRKRLAVGVMEMDSKLFHGNDRHNCLKHWNNCA
jgi:hypothetical protein